MRLFKCTIAFVMMTFYNLVLADTSSLNDSTGMGVLENDYVKAGVNKTSGTFGSGGNTSPGLLYDSTGTGDFNTSYDYLTPGSPFDGWSIKIDGTNSTNNNTGSASWTDSDGLSDGDNTLTWQGTNSSYSGWQVEHIYSLGATSQYIDITTNITAGTDASTVYFGRFIDPDARAASGDSSATDNVLGYSGIPSSNVSFSEATVSRYALGLYSTNTNVDAGISSGWTTEADGYTDSPYTDSDGNSVLYGTGDHTIGLTWQWTGVSAGDILTADYAYIFGPSAFDAADTAIDGGAGGGTPGETPSDWGTVEDVGSATDAASGASSGPTAIGTATSSITSHSASEADGVQTIARTKTTSTWTVYDDASTSDPTVSTESLSSFTGRVDQIETINNMMQLTNREVDFHGIKLLNDNSKASNGMAGDVVGVVVGGKRDLDNGWALGAGFGKLDARADNNSDWVEADSVMFNVHAERELVDGSVRLSLTNSNVDYSLSRVIGDFSNTASTTGVDRYARIQWTAGGEKFRPILGYTKGVTRVEGYTEAGSIQSARTVARDNDWYRFASVGFEFNLTPSLSGSYVHDTDGTNSLAVGLDKTINDKTLTLEFGRVETETTAANTLSANLNIVF